MACEAWANSVPNLAARRQKVVTNADEFLEKLDISYIYGGNKVGSITDCEQCNRCLEEKLPKAKERFKACPICSECSIDCSHFVQLVFSSSGIRLPYLTTATMLETDKLGLARRYGLIDIGIDLSKAEPGDLLVYRGHVVILAEKPLAGRGRIVHATGGKDIKLAGQGIQTERSADLAHFRGPILRILRAKALTGMPKK